MTAVVVDTFLLLGIANRHDLTVHDAAYLEFALRQRSKGVGLSKREAIKICVKTLQITSYGLAPCKFLKYEHTPV